MTRVGPLWRVHRQEPLALAPYVHERAGYVGVPGPRYEARLVPNNCVMVVVNLGAPFTRMGRLDGPPPTVSTLRTPVGGLEDGPGVVEHPGGQEALRIQVTPLGAYRLFAMPLSELSNTVVGLDDVLGPAADELIERLAATTDWARRFALLDNTLLHRIDQGPAVDPHVAHAWHLLTAGPRAIPIARIAKEIGWSHKHLLRRFTHQIGLTPKSVARIVRFQHAVALLSSPGAKLAEVSATCKFYDQAHMNRDFRELAGVSPKLCASSPWAAARAVELD
ncbi:helix-turn-helix domain-containing protein [Embleya sp. NPDC059259]|uniref:helix-turn-helix domain-containing protein n=1 Tax=unclassified Embleya TaxID=2699296 RepID=UPI0036B0DE8C